MTGVSVREGRYVSHPQGEGHRKTEAAIEHVWSPQELEEAGRTLQ